ncbi:tRNA uridine-5-carboxymethylaminomethyl(34) synthesis GTPase MnmE [Sulfurospirillum diekertiae]|uniref:tRNA modification GTPase MnmE n=1 Tax=Sulfurospirillum diekertiae TaxID=1854492 RepID=A0A6G9VQM1_9BACT|nr:tRNA uridine-5-carboxymethylaminomethyl(34) synthesis GTPase MnmE [Sulfurospirillum diekertiae]QIR74923.1 tRNA uridine-5-carboxymethylaminomethyl(34) synthesis GTPase MnmE [Sulfurospirillum diekertiae]QIR77588.1 tRNA uridine-5-carboxymethylaminomethyl(34) synthesis GTPase MnmE [Sulfurospirillum diekertiae]
MDTIAAIATSAGVGSIAIVRVSGPDALALAQKLSHKKTFDPRLATLTFLYDAHDDAIDQAIVIYFKAPHSFTAEDVVEFQCHGGSIVAGIVLEALIYHGARLANPGEFSKRAFLNGRIDLSEAEAIAALIETKSVDAAKMLTRQLKGELRDFVLHVRELLIEILAFVEVNIDYAEEDLPLNMIENIRAKLDILAKELLKTYESSKRRQGLIQGFKIAIVGKPNVGKSSLLNTLLSYDRAIISDIAGTTRDTIEEELRIGTHLVRIVDTAGIRQAHDVIEKIGIERSIAAIEESEIVIALFDNSMPCDNEDKEILTLLQNYVESKQILTVLNKIDLPNQFDTQHLGSNFIALSCQNDSYELTQKLEILLDQTTIDDSIMLTSARQIEAVKRAHENVLNSYKLLGEGELELFAFHINEAIHSISSITTAFERDEILEKMFSSFCLGK